MSIKKVYAIGTSGFTTYAIHTEEMYLWRFENCRVVTKAEYQKARKDGMPSWGERQTKMKMEDSIYNRKNKRRKEACPT